MRSNGSGKTNGRESILRREVLRRAGMLGAGGSMVGLAGCGGNDATTDQSGNGDTPAGDDTPGGNGEGEDTTAPENVEPLDDSFTLQQAVVPSDAQYNPWNGKNFANPNLMLYDRLMYFNLESKEYGPFALSEWDFQGDAISMTLKDDYTWHDGNEVTAQDLLIQLKLDMYTGGTLGDSVTSIQDGVQKVDDKTVEMQFKKTYNENIILGRVRGKRIYGYRDVYQEHLEKIEDATTDEDQSAAVSTLRDDFTYTEPVGQGPFKWESADPNRTLLSKYEDHWAADEINFPNMEFLYLNGNNKRWQAIINNQVDGNKALFMPSNQLKQVPDDWEINRIPVGRGVGVAINWENEHLRKRPVRQALAHAINRQEVATNSGGGTETKIPVNYPSGISSVFSGRDEDYWLDGITDQFETYGRDSSQTEQAASLLQEAGYEKDGGTWVDAESGETLSLTLKGPSAWPDWASAGRTVVNRLKQFGIDAEMNALDISTYWGKDYTNGNFDLALQSIQAFGFTYPFFDYDWIYRSYDANDIWSLPDTFEDIQTLDGSTTSMTPGDMVAELGSTESGTDKEMELVRNLAYTTNQVLPGIPLVVKLRMSWLSNDDWNVPSAGDTEAQVIRPPYMLPHRGEWTAKTE